MGDEVSIDTSRFAPLELPEEFVRDVAARRFPASYRGSYGWMVALFILLILVGMLGALVANMVLFDWLGEQRMAEFEGLAEYSHSPGIALFFVMFAAIFGTGATCYVLARLRGRDFMEYQMLVALEQTLKPGTRHGGSSTSWYRHSYKALRSVPRDCQREAFVRLTFGMYLRPTLYLLLPAIPFFVLDLNWYDIATPESVRLGRYLSYSSVEHRWEEAEEIAVGCTNGNKGALNVRYRVYFPDGDEHSLISGGVGDGRLRLTEIVDEKLARQVVPKRYFYRSGVPRMHPDCVQRQRELHDPDKFARIMKLIDPDGIAPRN